MSTISFFAAGEPKGQPRPRAAFFKGRARVYDPGTAEGWKSAIAVAAKGYAPKEPLQGPMHITLDFRMARPKGHYRSGKLSHVLRHDAPDYHTAKPDGDNLIKAVKDTLTNLRFWHDDAQVSSGVWEKKYTDPTNPHTGCLITIRPLTTQTSNQL